MLGIAKKKVTLKSNLARKVFGKVLGKESISAERNTEIAVFKKKIATAREEMTIAEEKMAIAEDNLTLAEKEMSHAEQKLFVAEEKMAIADFIYHHWTIGL